MLFVLPDFSPIKIHIIAICYVPMLLKSPSFKRSVSLVKADAHIACRAHAVC